MSKVNSRFCLEVEHFLNSKTSNQPPETPYHNAESDIRLPLFLQNL